MFGMRAKYYFPSVFLVFSINLVSCICHILFWIFINLVIQRPYKVDTINSLLFNKWANWSEGTDPRSNSQEMSEEGIQPRASGPGSQWSKALHIQYNVHSRAMQWASNKFRSFHSSWEYQEYPISSSLLSLFSLPICSGPLLLAFPCPTLLASPSLC